MKMKYSVKVETQVNSQEFITRVKEVGFETALKELKTKLGEDRFEIEGWDCCMCNSSDTYLEQNDEKGEEFNNHCCNCHNIEFATREEVLTFLNNQS